jgi:hypothetical protein
MKFEIEGTTVVKKVTYLDIIGTLKSGRRMRYTVEVEPGQEQAILAEFQADHKAAIAKYDAVVEIA